MSQIETGRHDTAATISRLVRQILTHPDHRLLEIRHIKAKDSTSGREIELATPKEGSGYILTVRYSLDRSTLPALSPWQVIETYRISAQGAVEDSRRSLPRRNDFPAIEEGGTPTDAIRYLTSLSRELSLADTLGLSALYFNRTS